jgi:hypothetical protein
MRYGIVGSRSFTDYAKLCDVLILEAYASLEYKPQGTQVEIINEVLEEFFVHNSCLFLVRGLCSP